ncbi:MAG: acyl-CoA dehydrogenase family protein [Paracoccaceae bacterium]
MYKAPINEIKFLLKNLFQTNELFKDKKSSLFDEETLDGILDQVRKLSENLISPINRDGDMKPAFLNDGKVILPKSFSKAYKSIAEGGWVGISGSTKYGGMGLPLIITTCVNEILSSACLSLALNPLMTQGQIDALESHANEDIKKIFLPKLNSGEWSGTMNLTEPQAGSDVGALRSVANKDKDGTYKVTGQKIYISWGDHSLSSNICHLLLARLPNSPKGTKGISLFLVPKYIPDNRGNLTGRNFINTVSLEHKMGLHGSPTAVLEYQNAKGWLVGEENKGMMAMFTMMNNARLGVAVQGLSQSELATQKAIEFAKNRHQGRNLNNTKDHSTPIINHADVRRNLLIMKSLTFISRALCFDTALTIDLSKKTNDSFLKRKASFLTPIAKSFCTEMGSKVADMAIQVHGGMGYIEETGISQVYRDVRVTSIYEGTNGIQAMDFVGRKLGSSGDVAYSILQEIEENEEAIKYTQPKVAHSIENARVSLNKAIDWMISQNDLNDRYSGADPFLRAFALMLGANYMVKTLLITEKEDKNELAHFYIKNLLPFCSIESSISTLGSDNLYASENSIF